VTVSDVVVDDELIDIITRPPPPFIFVMAEVPVV